MHAYHISSLQTPQFSLYYQNFDYSTASHAIKICYYYHIQADFIIGDGATIYVGGYHVHSCIYCEELLMCE